VAASIHVLFAIVAEVISTFSNDSGNGGGGGGNIFMTGVE
jgi:hypothetical protein